jgi:hypothetical protein
MDRFHGSAGTAWAGREFSANPFAPDDGSTQPEIAHALTRKTFLLLCLFQSLKDSRLLIPLLAELGDGEVGAHGKLVDKSADLSIVAVATPDGLSAIPAFTSVEMMQLWKKDARPVPIEAGRIARAAIAEGCSRVILNLGSDSIGLRQPLLASFAEKIPWIPPHQSERVYQLVQQAIFHVSRDYSL